MESNGDVGVFVPLGDFLTADDPVWVWDAVELRIVWANKAGRDFWGVDSVDTLRAKRFDSRNQAARRMSDLAEIPGKTGDGMETLALPAAFGRIIARCSIQSLQIAGGHAGLIVKVLDFANGRDRDASGQAASIIPPTLPD